MSAVVMTASGGYVTNADGAVLTYLQSLSAPGADTPATIPTATRAGETSINNPAASTDYVAASGTTGHVVAKKAPAKLRDGEWAVQQDGVWLCGSYAAKHVAGLLGTPL
jgi:hypothetical protein